METRSGEEVYIPDQGDIIQLNFDPQAGHEQKGRRPAVVLSPLIYNTRSGLAIVCPITNQVKNYPFEVRLPQSINTSGVVLSDQVKSIDWKERRARFIEKMPRPTLIMIKNKIQRLLPLD